MRDDSDVWAPGDMGGPSRDHSGSSRIAADDCVWELSVGDTCSSRVVRVVVHVRCTPAAALAPDRTGWRSSSLLPDVHATNMKPCIKFMSIRIYNISSYTASYKLA